METSEGTKGREEKGTCDRPGLITSDRTSVVRGASALLVYRGPGRLHADIWRDRPVVYSSIPQ